MMEDIRMNFLKMPVTCMTIYRECLYVASGNEVWYQREPNGEFYQACFVEYSQPTTQSEG